MLAVLVLGKQGHISATLEDFRQDFVTIVERHGWSYSGGRNWRTRVIFDTNLRTSYAADRWEQIERNKARRPYLRYVAILDDKTRPQHRAWHDIVLPVDHPFWQQHYPPNGWYCRCIVQKLSQRDLERLGLSVTPDDDLPGHDHAIDEGFHYNVGEVYCRARAEKIVEDYQGSGGASAGQARYAG